MNYPDKYILIEADYGKYSIFIDASNIDLKETDIDLLSTAIWEFHYETSGVKLEKPVKKLIWEFKVISKELINVISEKLTKIITELFPDKVIGFSEENKYE